LNSYADTSFLASLYVHDVNSRAAISLAKKAHPVFVVTPFGEAEFTSIIHAICGRPKGWTVREARAIEENFTHDLQTGIWRWEDLPPATWSRTGELARRFGPTLGCRAVDALHVASALTLAAENFYTFDRDQAKLARAAGLHVIGA